MMCHQITRYVISLLIVVPLLMSVGSVHLFVSADEVPEIKGEIYLQDPDDMLLNLEGEKDWIINLGKKLEDLTQAQIAILVVEEHEDQNINDFAEDAFARYDLGDKDLQNGVLVVASLYYNDITIVVGEGLKEELTKDETEALLYQHARPYLRYVEPDRAMTKIYAALYNEVGDIYGIDESDFVEISGKSKMPLFVKILIIAIIPVVAMADVIFFKGRFFASLINTFTNVLSPKKNRTDSYMDE